MVEVLDFKDDFEVFNRPRSIETSTDDFSHLSLAQVSQIQEDSSIPEAMGLQCKLKTSLLDLLESHARGNAPKKPVQPMPTTPPPPLSLPN